MWGRDRKKDKEKEKDKDKEKTLLDGASEQPHHSASSSRSSIESSRSDSARDEQQPPEVDRRAQLIPRKSIFNKLFPSRSNVKSITLADVIRQLEEAENIANEELDLLAFLSEDPPMSQPRSASLDAQLPPKDQPRKKDASESLEAFSWIKRAGKSKKKDATAGTAAAINTSSSNIVSRSAESSPGGESPTAMVLSRADIDPPTPSIPPRPKSEIIMGQSFLSKQGSAPLLPASPKPAPETPKVVGTTPLSSSAPSLPTTPLTAEAGATPVQLPEPKSPEKTKTARELVLEQRAAIAEKRARFLKLLKEQAEKKIKAQDFAYSPQDPRHWGEREPLRFSVSDSKPSLENPASQPDDKPTPTPL